MSSLLTDRYDLKLDADGHWTVIDVFTGRPTDYKGRFLRWRDERLSRSLCTMLNSIDHHHRRLAARAMVKGCSPSPDVEDEKCQHQDEERQTKHRPN
jgi:hypothetical protein